MDIESFIQAIINDPHDLTARLIFADFLEEIGDPRSEMIRLQFQRAEMGRDTPGRRAVRTRELKLVKEHGCFGDVPSLAKVLATEGGFIDAIEITVARFLKYQDEIFQKSPIRKVVFTGNSKRIAKLAESPYLGQLSSVTLKNNSDQEADLHKLVTSDRWRRLEELDVRGDWVTSNVVDAIATAPNLAGLKSLRLDGYHLESADAIQQVTHSPTIRQLREFKLSGATDEMCTVIAAAPQFDHLESLDVQGRFSVDRAMVAIHTSTAYPKLASLAMQNWHLGYAHSGSLASPFNVPSQLPHLKELDVMGALGSDAVQGILDNYSELECLRLSHNRINRQGAIELAQSELFAQLKRLYLTNNQIDAIGAIALGEAKQQRNKSLQLYLDGNSISRSEAKQLREQFGKTFLTINHMGSHY